VSEIEDHLAELADNQNLHVVGKRSAEGVEDLVFYMPPVKEE